MRFLLSTLAVALVLSVGACAQRDNCTSDFCSRSCTLVCGGAGPSCVSVSGESATNDECATRCAPGLRPCEDGGQPTCGARGCGEAL